MQQIISSILLIIDLLLLVNITYLSITNLKKNKKAEDNFDIYLNNELTNLEKDIEAGRLFLEIKSEIAKIREFVNMPDDYQLKDTDMQESIDEQLAALSMLGEKIKNTNEEED